MNQAHDVRLIGGAEIIGHRVHVISRKSASLLMPTPFICRGRFSSFKNYFVFYIFFHLQSLSTVKLFECEIK